MIPYGRQDISDDDVAAVAAVLRSDFLTQGPAVPRFEAAVMQATGAPHAVAVCNATAGLHIACLALGLKSGDSLWTSPNSFVASANAARYCGADADFVDIDPLTYNMSVSALAAKLAAAKASGRLPKIVMPVHFAGQSCDMKGIKALADVYGFRIIEDAAHAIGASYCDGMTGDCRFSDICVFSFHPVKIVTTGEGGVCTTREPELAARLAELRSHGITREPARMQWESEGGWYYQQTQLGFNYRMTDIQAALGASQMTRLQPFVQRRREIAQRYDRLLAGLPLVTPHQDAAGRSALHLYPVTLKLRETNKSRKQVFDELRQAGIGVNVHYIPVHTQPYYQQLGFRPGQFPQAEAYYAAAISLPIYSALTEPLQDEVVRALQSVLRPAA